MIYWLHTDLVALDEILAVWVNSLNDFVASAITEVSLLSMNMLMVYFRHQSALLM